MEYMLFSTEKYNFFNPEIPGFGIEKNVRGPGIRDPGITIPS